MKNIKNKMKNYNEYLNENKNYPNSSNFVSSLIDYIEPNNVIIISDSKVKLDFVIGVSPNDAKFSIVFDISLKDLMEGRITLKSEIFRFLSHYGNKISKIFLDKKIKELKKI